MDSQNKNLVPALECAISNKKTPFEYLSLPKNEELILIDDLGKNDTLFFENQFSKLKLDDEDDGLKDLDLYSLDSGNYLECTICLRIFSPSRKPYVYTECSHVMCIQCLLKWIFMPENSKKISCVVCRRNLPWVRI